MRKEYKILLTASLLVSLGSNMIGPFYAVFVQEIGGSVLDIGYTTTIFGLAAGMLMIAVGKLSDKLNKELVTLFGYFFYAIGTFGYLIVSSPWQLFILQVVFALAVACLSAPLSALFAKYIQKKDEGLEWGLSHGGTYIVVGLGVFAGTLIVDRFGFTYLFWIMFGVQVLATLVQAKLYLETRRPK